ncbi:hypothetical protein [Actibacterium sp. D379-3]
MIAMSWPSAACPQQAKLVLSGAVALSKGNPMSKGNKQHGNKEAKKPKQEKPKVLATANSNAGKAPLVVAGKKIK